MLKPKQYVKLAQSLPPQLRNFFARYPTRAILPEVTAVNTTSHAAISEAIEKASRPVQRPVVTEETSPFKPHKHPITGKWHDPVFSLRRQAQLCKLARQHGVEELLPLSAKSMEEKLRKRMENGLRVKGTGVGQRVKGKESERTLKARLEKRRKAMLEMPQMIQTWKERGHGRGWKKWPK
ncbi:putative 54S ribosomal protein L25, mitochondrial [Sclerotinia borealis F-4128]|uniref:Putative 54S ribosomal protein L25, mitochondrial n=1 Tax=Sclerotinia borealis (strain F-4128) TaxID=1432307 RepID=W9CTU5_SCLBF|nr:putative 54S ribosomal protein L25, mitochondrial [Sclerotinia borealis F-4128]